ncbi:hypothetical protein LR48_Vigan10g124200 [Vigna angularis]|uniref:Ubiquitin-like protease family profile domain-containing protein n=1 Tax=Phaseolus angularis TaxID=3914 RepID=A0A0L9VJX2_PHAAN|nr:hypothetical protein LR48_Vigan10g124200 [Vigna angularis]
MSTLRSERRPSVTRLPEVTSQRVDGKRRHVDIDPRSGVPSRPKADRVRSYLSVLAKTHVSILLNSSEDFPKVDKNLLWQDIQGKRYMDTVIVDQDRSSMYEFFEPQTIQPSGNTIKSKQKYLETWMAESNKEIYFVPYIDGSHWKLMLIIPKQCKICNKQLDSWECGYYVLSWIKTIIRAIITDDWNERFKSTSVIPEDAIKKIR